MSAGGESNRYGPRWRAIDIPPPASKYDGPESPEVGSETGWFILIGSVLLLLCFFVGAVCLLGAVIGGSHA